VVSDAGSLAIGDTFTVTIEDERFRNPPSTRPVKDYRAKSYKNNMTLVAATGHQEISYAVATAAKIPSSNVSITSVSGEINDDDQFDFTIQMPLPLPVGAVVTLKIPPSIQIYEDQTR